jgi:hypothetical protein
VHLTLLAIALMVGLATLTFSAAARAIAAGCMVAFGCVSLLLTTREGTRALDRIPLACPASPLAHHALALYTLVHDSHRSGPEILKDAEPILDAVARAGRRIHPEADGTIPRIAAEDITGLAAVAGSVRDRRALRIPKAPPEGSVGTTAPLPHSADLSGVADMILTLTHLAADR